MFQTYFHEVLKMLISGENRRSVKRLRGKTIKNDYFTHKHTYNVFSYIILPSSVDKSEESPGKIRLITIFI